MPSDAKILANRMNALRSTGPKTAAGKARSALNALKHGLRADSALLLEEDRHAFEDLRRQVMAEHAPAGALEALLLDRLIWTVWRLRRVPWIEGGLLRNAATAGPISVADGSGRNGLGVAFVQLEQLDLLSRRLTRYESALAREVDRTLAQLQIVQAERTTRNLQARLIDDTARLALPAGTPGEAHQAPRPCPPAA